MSSRSQQPIKGRLISQFENRPTPSHPKAWSDLWDSGESSLWDRGMPSPALIDLLESYQDTLLHPFEIDTEKEEDGSDAGKTRKRRKRALVPGCGRGYDVITFALHGFDACGLEVSTTAVSEARAFAKKELCSPQSRNFGDKFDRERARHIGVGKTQFLQGDFFTDTWIENETAGLDQGKTENGKFDLVYDYTFLCALHPAQRTRWAERMADLLRPGGLLVCLEFPMYKDPALPGPPWGVNGVHWELLAGGDTGQAKFTRKVYVQPERTFEVGRGTDMISVYERK
ncbi:S-adenosyl-L-methionine-dependent methyltransferase, partial [Aspergillus tetrazonus]